MYYIDICNIPLDKHDKQNTKKTTPQNNKSQGNAIEWYMVYDVLMEIWSFSKINLKINMMASGYFRYMTTESA